MSRKLEIFSAWDCPTSEEVRAVIGKIGKAQACRILRKNRNSIDRWCNGESNIDYANWMMLKQQGEC